MMQRPNDEELVAFLDGEIDGVRLAEIEAWLDRDAGLRTRLASLTEATLLVREAFDDVLREPVPDRLIAAAQPKPGATILSFRPRLSAGGARALVFSRRVAGLAVAASLTMMVLGATGGYLAGGGRVASDDHPTQTAANAASSSWLDNIAGYHNMFIDNAVGAETTVFDVPPGSEKRLPAEIRIPDLKPWSLVFQGARKLIVEGKPAFQFFYVSDNKQLGSITLTVTNTIRPDSAPTFDRREDKNMLYWRHAGHGYAIVGTTDKGYMWGLLNDIGYQLKAM